MQRITTRRPGDLRVGSAEARDVNTAYSGISGFAPSGNSTSKAARI
jgi:hypothetical protein